MTASLTVYQQSVTIIHSFLHHSGSLKSLTLHNNVANKALTTKLVIETLKYRAILLHVLKHVNNKARKHEQLHLLDKADASDVYTLPICGVLLLLYDTLIGSMHLPTFKQSTKTITDTNNVEHVIKHKNDRYGLIPGHRYITIHLTQLRATLSNLLHQSHITDAEQLLPIQLHGQLIGRKYQRYIRINTLMTDKVYIKQQLNELGYSCVDSLPTITNNNQQHNVKQYCHDTYVPNLLQFAANDNSIVSSDLVKSNKLIIQDKSSCLPCIALNPAPNSIVLDCCAAPGNKSSLCAVLMNNTGTVYAIERDYKRCSIMKQRMDDMNAKSVHVQHTDFLSINPNDHTNPMTQATHILLDPSCSGSGTINADRLLGDEYDSIVAIPPSKHNNQADNESTSDRVLQLHAQQVELLKHAMTFKHAQRISYSTCSVYELENECVVHDVLDYARDHGYKLAHILPKWHRRGIKQSSVYTDRTYEWSNRVIRADATLDNTGGFFIAVFTRSQPTVQSITSVSKSTKKRAQQHVNVTQTNNVKQAKTVESK